MKIIYLVFIFFFFGSCRQNKTTLTVQTQEFSYCNQSIDSIYTNIGNTIETNPKAAIAYLRSILLMKDCPNINFVTIGQCLLNIGTIYDEHINQVDSSIVYLNQSFDFFLIHRDSVSAYNVSKYLGLQNVKSGHIKLGLSQIEKSLSYYKVKKMEKPYYVSLRNYAKSLHILNENENARDLMQKVVTFWKDQNDLRRLKIYENDLIEIENALDN